MRKSPKSMPLELDKPALDAPSIKRSLANRQITRGRRCEYRRPLGWWR